MNDDAREVRAERLASEDGDGVDLMILSFRRCSKVDQHEGLCRARPTNLAASVKPLLRPLKYEN